MKQLIVIILLLLGKHFTAKSQIRKLPDILSEIEQSHPSLKMYDATIKSLDAAAKGANNWSAPLVSTGLWMVPFNTNLWKAKGPGTTGMGQYMISGQQMFPNRRANDASEAYMKAMSTVEKENKEAALNELLSAAKKAYYEWIIIEKKITVLDQSEKLLHFMMSNAETRYKNGIDKISAYYKAKAALGTIENMRIELEKEIAQHRITLNTLMNADKFAPLAVDTNYVIKDYESSTFDSTLFYYTRSDLKAIDQNIEITFLQQKMERANQKPSFGIRYDHMFGFGGLPMQYSLMGMVTIPMNWSTRQNRANIESLHWKAQSLLEQKISLANDYSGMAYQLQQDMSAKKKQVALFEKNIIPALQKNYESTLLGYEQNTEELFELYDSWNTLNSSELEYLDELQQLLDIQADLDRLMQIK